MERLRHAEEFIEQSRTLIEQSKVVIDRTREITLREMASIRSELTRLNAPRKPPLVPHEFLHKHIAHLEESLSQLEQALEEHEAAAD